MVRENGWGKSPLIEDALYFEHSSLLREITGEDNFYFRDSQIPVDVTIREGIRTKLGKWVVSIHDQESDHTATIEIFQREPVWNGPLGRALSKHTPGRVATIQHWQGGKKMTDKNPDPELEKRVISSLCGLKRIVYGEPEKEREIHRQAWEELRPILFGNT